jgi:hypothetical protein
MEDILDLYQLAYNAKRPVVCMDEQPKQLIGETRVPIGPACGRVERYDYEYERKGTGEIFMFSEPLGCWRRVSARLRRTMVDWAQEIKILLDEHFPDAEKVILICDNLNTHKIGSLYEAFEPAEARRLAQRVEIHHTPKHGSWLNIAEIELSALTRQCLSGRTPDLETLNRITAGWEQTRNTNQKSIDWQFKTEDARIRLKRLYPQIQMS